MLSKAEIGYHNII